MHMAKKDPSIGFGWVEDSTVGKKERNEEDTKSEDRKIRSH